MRVAFIRDFKICDREGSVEKFSEEAMLIADLDYLDSVHQVHCYGGGLSVSASTQTIATRGFSYASSNATASGSYTSTAVQTFTKVANTAFYSSSLANAQANAYASAGVDSQARWTIYDSSLYVSISN